MVEHTPILLLHWLPWILPSPTDMRGREGGGRENEFETYEVFFFHKHKEVTALMHACIYGNKGNISSYYYHALLFVLM